MKIRLKLTFSLFLLAPYVSLLAQKDSANARFERVYGLHARHGSTVVHTQAVQNIRGANPSGIDLEFSKRKIAFNDWNIAGCFVKTGFLAGYYDFDNSIIGHAAVLSYFIEPTYRVGRSVQLYYHAGIGLDYLDKPYDINKNPTNKNYSSYINPYMHMSAGVGLAISKHITVNAEGSFHHTSNGQFKEPNKGVNWATLSLGLSYMPSGDYLPKYKRDRSLNRASRKLFFDVGLLAMPAQDYKPKTDSRRTFIGGIIGQVTKPISNTNGLTAGLEIYYSHYQKGSPASVVNTTDPVMVGIHAGHAFLLGRVTFSQQVGFLVIKPATFILGAYQRYNLGFQVSKRHQLGIGLQANSDNADFTSAYWLFRIK